MTDLGSDPDHAGTVQRLIGLLRSETYGSDEKWWDGNTPKGEPGRTFRPGPNRGLNLTRGKSMAGPADQQEGRHGLLSGSADTRRAMKAAIIGGSLSGCMAAILLGRAGHDVTVYERSKAGLVGRGGGLTTSRKVLDEMKSRDLLDADFPASRFDILRMCKRTEDKPYLGVNPLSAAIDMHCVHWGGLWQNLVKRVPSECYMRGQTLIAAEDKGDGVTLTFEDGNVEDVELVLFCDGYSSMGRQLLFPKSNRAIAVISSGAAFCPIARSRITPHWQTTRAIPTLRSREASCPS